MDRAKKTILLVDDEPSLRLLVRAALRNGSYRVLEAADGDEALALARRERPDLVLLDIGMPGIDGHAVCQALKSDPTTAEAKVLFLTARAHPDDRRRGVQVGADGYVTKPFSPIQLLNRIDQLLA